MIDEEVEIVILEVGQIEELLQGTTGVYRVETETAVYVINFDGKPMKVSRHPKEKHEVNPYPLGAVRLEARQLRKDREFMPLLEYKDICLGKSMNLLLANVSGDVGVATLRQTTVVRNISKIDLSEDPK